MKTEMHAETVNRAFEGQRVALDGTIRVSCSVGLWRSWERASMAWKRSRVRIPSGPPISPRFVTQFEMTAPSGNLRRVSVSQDVICQAVDDELILLKLSSQQHYGLGAVGTHAWQLLCEDGNVAAVEQRLCESYQGDPATIRGDLHALLRDLIDAGLLTAADD